MNIPPTLAAEQALLQQNVALSVVRSNAEAEQQLVNIIQETAETISASNRGNTVNISA